MASAPAAGAVGSSSGKDDAVDDLLWGPAAGDSFGSAAAPTGDSRDASGSFGSSGRMVLISEEEILFMRGRIRELEAAQHQQRGN